VQVALVYPDLLGTYGDSGNAVILAQRLRWRGYPAEIVEVNAGGTVPDSCDLYVVGGGEDLPQSLAASQLNADRPLHRAVERGAAVLAVCAGLQVLGEFFFGPDGVNRPGLGLLDCVSRRGTGPRAVGELVVEPTAEPSLPLLTGYENHGAVTVLGPGARPAGRVRSGVGNGAGSGHARHRDHDGDDGSAGGSDDRPHHGPDHAEGAVAGHIWGTYLHGPVLARNPALADLLLSWVTGPLVPLDDTESEALRAARLQAAPAEASVGAGRGDRFRRAVARFRRAPAGAG
jgi:CobQ-like glutamine amidotransferase family enzyme